MKFWKFGNSELGGLDLPREIEPIEFAKRSPLNRLNFLLDIIKEERPGAYHQFIINLETKYKELTEHDLVERYGIDVDSLLDKFEILKGYPALARVNLNFYLCTLLLPEDVKLKDGKVVVSQRNQLRSLLVPKYHNIETLTQTIGREAAIEIYKRYLTRFMDMMIADDEERFQNLEEFVEDTRIIDPDNPGWHGIVSEPENGRVILRKDSCLWDEALPDIMDRELKYLVCCYADFASIKISNKNFALTMEHTIAAGHPYCDCVIYDTRITDNRDYPSDEFFRNLQATEN